MCPPPLPSLFWSPDIPGTLWMHVPISPHVYTIPQCIYIIYMTAFPCPSKPFSFGSNIDQEFHIAQHAGHVKAYYWHRMKYDIHIKRSIEEIESNEEELMKYLSSPLSNDERGLIDTARWRRTLMRKVRKQSVPSTIGTPIDDRFWLSVATYILKNLLRALRYS